MATLLQEAAQLVTEDSSLGELIDNALDISDNAAVVSIADAPVNAVPATEVLVDILDSGTSVVEFNNIDGLPLQVPTLQLTQPLVLNETIPLPLTQPLEDVVNDSSVHSEPLIACIDYPLPVALIEVAIAAPLARPIAPMGILPIEEFLDPLLDTVPEDGFVDPLLDIIQVDEPVDPLLDTVPVDEFVETKPWTLEGVTDGSDTSGARLAGPPALGLATLLIDVPPAEEGADPLLDTVPVEDFVDPLLDIMPVGEAIAIEEVVFTKPLTLDGLDTAVPTDTTVMNGDGAVLPEGTFDPCTCWAAPLTDPVGSGSAVDPTAPPVLLADYAAPTSFIVDYAAPPAL
jgi:hypothetical protein